MATVPASLFFKNNRDYKVGAIQFDLILNEDHSFSNTVSGYSIEDGSTITDHIKNNLESASASFLITNFSITQNALTSNRAQDVFDKLYELWKKRELVEIATILKVYKDVAITNFSTSRDENTGEALFASISWQEMKIVKLKEVIVEGSLKIKDTKSAQNKKSSPTLDVGKTSGVG